MVGALIGWHIPEERIKECETGIREGAILMGLRPRPSGATTPAGPSAAAYRQCWHCPAIRCVVRARRGLLQQQAGLLLQPMPRCQSQHVVAADERQARPSSTTRRCSYGAFDDRRHAMMNGHTGPSWLDAGLPALKSVGSN